MNYSKIDPMSIVDGDGCRVSLFVSGCRNHCDGCFNPETWNFDYGQQFDGIAENEIIEACRKPYISGITILGGAPKVAPSSSYATALIVYLPMGKSAVAWDISKMPVVSTSYDLTSVFPL